MTEKYFDDRQNSAPKEDMPAGTFQGVIVGVWHYPVKKGQYGPFVQVQFAVQFNKKDSKGRFFVKFFKRYSSMKSDYKNGTRYLTEQLLNHKVDDAVLQTQGEKELLMGANGYFVLKSVESKKGTVSNQIESIIALPEGIAPIKATEIEPPKWVLKELNGVE